MGNPNKRKIFSKLFITKRVRGLKSKLKLNKSLKDLKIKKKKNFMKAFDMNYYLESKINILLSEEENTINRLRKKEDSEFLEMTN